MSDVFREQSRALDAIRREKNEARDRLSLARDRELRGARRGGGEDAEAARAALRNAAAREREMLGRMAELSDPRRAVATLSDTDPLLMLPVRLETRFRRLAERDGGRHELWLRIYPDDCVVDAFEKVPSDSEIKATQLYWLNLWRAGGDADGERAAWDGLAASCGAGRAAWLARNYLPLNAGQKPTKSPAHETLLIAGGEKAPTPSVRAALEKYWPAVWKANGSGPGLTAARQALVAELGGEAAATAAVEHCTPFNLKDPPSAPGTRASPPARFLVIQFPDGATIETQRFSWGSSPKAHVLPDRFVALGYADGSTRGSPAFVALGEPLQSPLVLGIDPVAPKGEQLDGNDGDLVFGEELAWMVEFDAAVAGGMAMRIPITADHAERGFGRIIVIGVRATAGPDQARALLEELLSHHRDGRTGVSLLAQGTPTNNVEEKAADYRLAADADRAYAAAFTDEGVPIAAADWADQRDGARLAAAIGVSLDALHGLVGVNGSDQLEARTMNEALFPGTLGYFLHDMLGEAVSAETFEALRDFFLRLVSGRGPVPAIRIGAQPYGVLPTTAYSRLSFSSHAGHGEVLSADEQAFLSKLTGALRIAERDWARFAAGASWIGGEGDRHRTLLDVLGHHPASAEFYRRTAESIEEHFNRLNLVGGGIGRDLARALESVFRKQEIPALLARLGFNVSGDLPISERIFAGRQHRLGGPIVDDAPLSETDPIRPYTQDGRNYLAWLAEAALADMDTLRRELGFAGDMPPRALLYIILRFALLSGYRHEATDRLLALDMIDAVAARAYRRDPAFVHVRQDQGAASESRWSQLYASIPEPAGGVGARLLHQRITADLRSGGTGAALRAQVDAIARLSSLPTARLERLFAEHVDCLSYRVDSWRTGLAFRRLQQMRRRSTDEERRRGGILLGAYGWVENVSPKPALTPFELPQDLAADFPAEGLQPLAMDPTNQGFVHAPSLDHAVTAAILRNGHMSMADPATGAELAINLSSERVRRALGIMQGMGEGQSVGALLGYQLERGLHEQHAPLELDKFIQPLRNEFPLDLGSNESTAQPAGAPGAVAARNVVDGRKLAARIQSLPPAQRGYPFGMTGLPQATPQETAAIAEETDRLLDTLDAVADVALAESVHQTARGNFDRAAGMLDAFSRGTPPPEPEITSTPRSGVTLTHRVAIHLDPNAPTPATATPRSLAEPRVEGWLRKNLPALDSIACSASFFNQATNAADGPMRISVEDLGLGAIDLVMLMAGAGQQGAGALDELIVSHVEAAQPVAPDSHVQLEFAKPPDADSVTFFEIAPLVSSLRALLAKARPVKAADLGPPANPYPDPSPTLDLDASRIAARVAPLATIRDDGVALQSDAASAAKDVHDGVAGAPGQLVAQIDGLATRLSGLSRRAAFYGLATAGFTTVQEGRRSAFATVRRVALETAVQWSGALAKADLLLDQDETLAATPGASEEDRRAALRAAEALVSSTLAFADSLPDPVSLRGEVITKRDAFAAKIEQFKTLSRTQATTIKDLLDDAAATLPVSDFRLASPGFDAGEGAAVRLCEDIAAAASALADEAAGRVASTEAALGEHQLAGTDPARAAALDVAAKALFSDAFVLVPGVRLSAAPRDDDSGATQAGDWATAIAAAGAGGLFHHLEDELGRLDPVDEWLAAVARVRAPMKQLERVFILAEGFGAPSSRLDAFQLPYVAGDSWLGAEFPGTQDLRRDRLLYSVLPVAGGWNPAEAVFGLLVDEWVETLPSAIETTGVAFHYDRPNSEPPQAMLLVVPPVLTGAWSWDDIVDAVNETLDLAKQRAVEPVHLDSSAYARLLPSLLFATAHSEITLVADLSVNNLTAFSVGDG